MKIMCFISGHDLERRVIWLGYYGYPVNVMGCVRCSYIEDESFVNGVTREN